MPYSIYEQQQQLLDRRVVFDENNPYGTTELRPNLSYSGTAIYNDHNQTDSNQSAPNQQSSQPTANGHQPPLPQIPGQPNGLAVNSSSILNGQQPNINPPINPLLDPMSNLLLNSTNTAMNHLNQSNAALLNNSLQMPTAALSHPHHSQNHHGIPQFAPMLPSNLDPNVRWRDPDLPEVIEFLKHPNPIVKANAAAYLQHLSFMDDSIKQKARALGSIGALINALNYEIQLLTAQANQQQLTSENQLQTQPSRDVQRNCLGALRNLSFGRQNDENKRAIKAASGIHTLVALLKFSLNDKELKELITGILWNLSSSEEIKTNIIDEAVKEIVNYIIIPGSGWDGRVNISGVDSSYDPVYGTGEIYWATVFRNSTGVLRNVSSAGEYARYALEPDFDLLLPNLLKLLLLTKLTTFFLPPADVN